MTASQRRIPLSYHRICSPPLTRGHKIRVISAQIEFLGGTGCNFIYPVLVYLLVYIHKEDSHNEHFPE